MSNILVTGATGHLGSAVIETLLKKTKAAKVTILVRNAEKTAALKSKGVNIAIGDYSNYQSLIAAFQGIDKIYLVSGNDIANRAHQHENVINAAKEAGVKHIVYSSFQRKNESADSPIAFIANSHLSTEQALKASGLVYTLLQHTLYADIIPVFAGDQLLQTKTIYLPAGTGKTAFAVRTDLAEAGANVLIDETGKYNNLSIELTGPESVSWEQIASIISSATGEKIVYVSPSVEEFTIALTSAQVPAEYIGMFAGFSQATAEGEFESVNNELENLLGRKQLTVASYLKSVYQG